MCVCVYLCLSLCVYIFVHARYLKSDLPDLVGPCNIDVWNESHLTGEEFSLKYVCIGVHALYYTSIQTGMGIALG